MGKNFSALTAVGFVTELIFVLGFAGCDKKSGEAVVIEKEHIAAKEIHDTLSSETPSLRPKLHYITRRDLSDQVKSRLVRTLCL